MSSDERYIIRAVTDGKSWALKLFQEYMDRRLGDDPLAEGDCHWTAWKPNTYRTRTAAHPMQGWRCWSVLNTDAGPRLAAPFLTAIHGEALDLPGVLWLPGVNTNSTRHCNGFPGRHPQIDCTCGIRAMRSLGALRAFHAFAVSQEPDTAPLVAFARVNCWGRLAQAAQDDFRFTIRCELAAITGPLYVDPPEDRAATIDSLAEHYGVTVRPAPAGAVA